MFDAVFICIVGCDAFYFKCVCVCVCLFLSVEILGCLVIFMSIYTVCHFSATEIIKYSESESESDFANVYMA